MSKHPQTDDGRLDIFVQGKRTGTLGRSAIRAHTYVFGYQPDARPQQAVSLTMPVMPDQYGYQQGVHPIFQMNLPEGELRELLRNRFQKAVQNFDDLALLGIVGHSQIGRIRIAPAGSEPDAMPLQNMQELRTYAGAEGLFTELMQRYANYSGISGVQPKVLVRDAETVAATAQLEQVSYRDATHIVKAWNPERFPQLAANEYFCMQAARKAGLETPEVELAAQGHLLIVKRFDLDGKGGYLGFEDFCVLNGLATDDKYVGSYQDIATRIRQFVSPHRVHEALEQFFLSLALTCAVRNGDAHLKNFGVLYDDPESEVRLAPAFDIVSTTPYIPNDTLALLFGGSKAFPERKALLLFARQFCNIHERRANRLLEWVAHGLEATLPELQAYQQENPAFVAIGTRMQAVWQQGIAAIMGKDSE
ncbi:MAG TPA: type II toxin-antitoxin system HipA family toxin [Candidatus Thiothrix moscowensis]|uniref:type II toxin-antitoxin system HipA family toxin n=1 Tax=unclassified Thiothrix TaxID=2636184 RepID=UPI0025CD1475|nr:MULTISPECIES: type II toxin-antitoxin system HipA family toxin [unclassified Thiothrix]HRJ51860.1 type II toxin-antitoxin system HipA family toxin [Candidatus Thiothrix moscowensis]HRJ92175.1 type II toxin-antitoxin system HipA family toxin [Candidatus Thiothrix moscowensis]